MYPKVFIGPMSKNIVKAAVELSKEYPVGLIPSRRQVDHQGGYVNSWSMKGLREYVGENLLIERDHGGPGQGTIEDNGELSLAYDVYSCDIIHIDPWKIYKDYHQGIDKTIDLINFCHEENPNIEFEIGTEQSIRSFTQTEYNSMLQWLKTQLPGDVWKKIKFVVVQSGTGLDLPNQKNTGIFDADRLKSQLSLIKYRNKLSKEHNGDYLTAEQIQTRFKLGVDAINIAPEIGQYETQAIIDASEQDYRSYFLSVVLQNKHMYRKWFEYEEHIWYDPYQTVITGGHYVLSQLENPPDVYDAVKERLRKRLEDIYA